jgi:hypothetical protein
MVACAPVPVGRPVTVTAAGQRIVTRTWRLGGTQVVVAVSGSPSPCQPAPRACPVRAWRGRVRLGKPSLYCVNGQTSELVAAPVPAADLATLAARLPLA